MESKKRTIKRTIKRSKKKSKINELVKMMMMVTVILIMTAGCSKEVAKPADTELEKTVEETVEEAVEEVAEGVVKDTVDETKDESKEIENQEEEEAMNVIPELSPLNYELVDNETMRFIKAMKIGWNLGNTFDAAFDNPWFDDELGYESAWNGKVTTKEMIDEIKAAGFNTLRLPVSWRNHLVDDNFTISEVWMNRVKEVANYAIDNDMYVILNIHHDNHEEFYYPSSTYLENSTNYVRRIWEQIAERFADYDDKIIFESLNEPRLVGHKNEWWIDFNNPDCIDAIKVINALNQTFVDTVRKGSGNNSSRYLMVPGYAASPEGVLNDYFVIPQDSKENDNKIILSVHAYRPYAFALQGPTENGNTSEFSVTSTSSTSEIDDFMNKLYDKYTSKGIGVVLGEFGARNKNNNTQDRVDFSAYYIHAASARGMVAIWWDNNAVIGEGENFGLFDRSTNKWVFPQIRDALMQYTQ